MRQIGYTLVEVLLVVLILGVVAAAVVGTHGSVDAEQTLEAAAAEVAAAFRFARSEAHRTGEPHGVYASFFFQRVRVYRLDALGNVEYSVRHPVDKKLYDLDFSTDPLLGSVAVSSVAIWFTDVGVPVNYLGFADSSGVPKYNDGSGTHMLVSAAVTLAAAGQSRVVSVAPMNGRVTIQ